MKLYFKYVSMLLKSQMQYKASFIMTALGQFLVSFTAFLGVYFMFSRFHSVNGFAFSEILICFSIVLMAFSITECFVRGFDLFPRLIQLVWITILPLTNEAFCDIIIIIGDIRNEVVL